MKYHDTPMLWRDLLRRGLEEDGWPWDWTSLGIPARNRGRVRATIIAKSDGIWAADGLIEALPSVAVELGGKLRATASRSNGQAFRRGEKIGQWSGSARELLALERPFLNLAAYASGIATRTRRLVDLVRKACPERTPRVTATRKTLPGYRDIAIQGVLAGGGYSHRVSLAGGVLIKENHIAAAGGVRKAIDAARAISPHGLKIEIEVRKLSELRQALNSRADGVLLDNFEPEQVRQALRIAQPAKDQWELVVEVSGGLDEGNIARYAIDGVDILSVGSLSHSVTAADFSLLVD